ncbi:Hypothetical predicted protein [Paramuricea clavata]|uniref:Uncharacterized protein n=1 Tax=Paramuricea clavata TaxID=317549 RepID=A0A7D9DFL6_PARCT|nr:Hypothetical predicted protein [Paramuricea clavata]
MAVKLRRPIRPGRRNSKPRWRRLLLQSENALKVTLVGLDINNIGYLLHISKTVEQPYKMKPEFKESSIG